MLNFLQTRKKLTLVGRSYLLAGCLLLANLAVWTAAIALFAPVGAKRRVLSLCLVAWTFGLRHALDADHISAIDNATRQLVAKGQRPLTCGLFFSLGHSTVVISVTVAIAVSLGVADRLGGVSSVGGVIGVTISASFLLLLAIINTFILYRILRKRRRARKGLEPEDPNPTFGCIARAVRPLLRLIDKPWKLYPIGILFSFGFDTSSEIALLSVSALAQTPAGGSIAQSEILILPALFTAGISLVDTLDSILMLWGYAMPEAGEEHWKRIWRSREPVAEVSLPTLTDVKPEEDADMAEKEPTDALEARGPDSEPVEPAGPPIRREVYSELSIVLTIISIFVAFAISLIEFMGLALEKCAKCSEAAESSPGLDGRWWRFWAAMNDNSGYLGAGIVGVMLACGIGFVLWRRWKSKRSEVRSDV